jgi:uncharacterized repeat protein (TIGR01451 family)
MNCNPLSRTIRPRLIAILTVLLPAPFVAGAQGLFKLLDDPSYAGTHISVLPSGDYRLASSVNSIFTDGNHSTRHLITDLTPAGGVLQSTDYTFLPNFAWWLEDNTFIQVMHNPAIGPDIYSFVRTNLQNDTIWTQHVAVPPGSEYAEWKSVDINDAGEVFAFCSWIKNSPGNEDEISPVIIAKFAPNGDLLWQTEHYISTPGIYFDEPARVRSTADGGCMAVLTQLGSGSASTVILVRLNADGSLRWSVDTQKPRVSDFRFTADGGCMLIDNYTVWKIDQDGATIWSNNLYSTFEHPFYGPAYFSACLPTGDGGVAVLGYQTALFPVSVVRHLVAAKISATGEIVWWKRYNPFVNFSLFGGKYGEETSNGDLLWTGGLVQGQTGGYLSFIIKMDANGTIFTNSLAGKLAYDETNDCTVQANEPGLPGWLLKLESGGLERYGSTDALGNYFFSDVDTGALSLSLFVQNYLWEGCSPAVTAVVPPDSSGYTLPLDVPVRAVGDCPVMTVDLGVPFLRRCFNNTYTVKCCNEGNQTATDAFVEVYLPQHLLLQSASMPYVLTGNKITFQLGAVEPFGCVNIQMVVLPDCDSTVLGQSMCVSAQVYPDTICAPPPGWSGALVEVSAACDGDSVRFLIQNTGTAPMNGALDFIIIDDHVMTREGNFNLQPGEMQEEVVHADGSTFRLEAEQEPNAPGAVVPSVAVEGCLTDPDDPFTTGLVLQWPNENGSPFVDRDCHELVAAFDPNDKQAVPRGVFDEHFIKPNTAIDYLIRFQNTGTDTAFTVVLRDTLSPNTDPSSVHMGASSHPYTWNLSGAGILTVTLDNILLPDSNVNEAASHGFIKFHIRQNPDLPDGASIENRAGIYFDFNEPVLTNTVYHTVMRDFLPTVGTHTPEMIRYNTLSIAPNPASAAVWADLRDEKATEGMMTLTDAFGRVVRVWRTTGPVVEIRREGLPSGVYYLRWQAGAGVVRAGRVVWK